MNSYFRNIVLKLIPESFSNFIFYNHSKYKLLRNSYPSFSQEGEDMVLRRVFSNTAKGTYVDIGAHHPTIFSNTNYFYQLGWTGINVDALPGSKIAFDTYRPNDVNLELLVSENEGLTEFYLFEPSLMNTMSKEQAVENLKFDWCKLIGTTQIPSVPLDKLLDQYLAPGKKIDFMNIDVEGAEMAVLASNNWVKYSPNVLIIEIINIEIRDIPETPVYKFLTDLNFSFFAKTGNSLFFKKVGFFEF